MAQPVGTDRATGGVEDNVVFGIELPFQRGRGCALPGRHCGQLMTGEVMALRHRGGAGGKSGEKEAASAHKIIEFSASGILGLRSVGPSALSASNSSYQFHRFFLPN
jgi:hypothetical protein